jgi:hypothetical protein
VTLQRDHVTHTDRAKTAYFPLVDAALVAMEWIELDLPDTNILFLFLGRTEGGSDQVLPMSLNTWRVMGNAQRWSVMPFLREGESDVIGVFKTRATRDACPAWYWHYLGGSLLVDRTVEQRVGKTEPHP